MVFQSLLSSSVSSSFRSSSPTSLRGGLSQIGTKDSPPKTFELSAWRTFDRVSVHDSACGGRTNMTEAQGIVRKKATECKGWEGYLIEAERRCTEELCDWQV